MQKLIVPLIIGLAINGIAYAEPAATVVKPIAVTPTTVKPATLIPASQNNTTIKLYAEPADSAKVLATFNINQQLIPIFQKDGWIKVGNPADGNVGWINKDQYREAMNAAVHQSIQTVYVEQTDEKGKTPQITVYQNGKKLTGDQAKAVYGNIQKQQQQMQKNMQLFQKRMNRWMNQQMMPGPMMVFPPMPMMQPVIIVETPAANKESKK